MKGEKASKDDKAESAEEAKIKELTELLKRVQADFENYTKRVEREQKAFIVNANKELITSMLPVLESFELALKNSKNHKDFRKGVEMIYAQLFSLLESQGLKPIAANGKFDPYKHEALMQEKGEEDSLILEEFQKGYMLNDSVIRTSKLKVSKKVVDSGKLSNNNKTHS